MDILFSALALHDQHGGVDKKISAQAEALRSLGHRVALLCYSQNKFYFEGMDNLPSYEVKSGPVWVYLGLQKVLRLAAACHSFDVCYNRHIFATPFQLETLRILRRLKTFTIEEFPTYPYDIESTYFSRPAYRVAAQVDKVCRKYYKNLLNLAVSFGRDNEIFGVPAKNIENGVNVDKIPFFQRAFIPKQSIHLLAVSSMAPWHGYERLLQGLAEYYQGYSYKKQDVFIDIVGDGVCRSEWEALAKKINIADKVCFHGQLLGPALDNIFTQADIGIASLGWYKKQMRQGSELKIREYMARGLPFVYSSEERLFSPEDGFCLQVENGSKALNIDKIVGFYNSLCKTSQIPLQLRCFAENHYTWDYQMKKVMDAVTTMREG